MKTLYGIYDDPKVIHLKSSLKIKRYIVDEVGDGYWVCVKKYKDRRWIIKVLKKEMANNGYTFYETYDEAKSGLLKKMKLRLSNAVKEIKRHQDDIAKIGAVLKEQFDIEV